MKHCPKCNTDYFDNMLEFCLEDGEHLLEISETDFEIKTVPSIKKTDYKTENETVVLVDQNFEDKKPYKQKDEDLQKKLTEKSKKLKETATSQWLKFLEIFPIVLAIIHNYWQWLYLEKQRNLNIGDFLTSGVFLFWLFLLISGVLFAVFSLKYSKNKSFAIIALIMLAINLLLSIVPK